MFINLYNELNSTEKDEFSRIANKLLSICFLTKKKDENKKDYYFIQQHQTLFSEYFEFINWELEIDEGFGVIHLNNKQDTNRLNFKLNESIILLILRLLFQEKIQELSLSNQVVIRIEEVHNRYDALEIREKKLDKTTIRNAIRLFKRFNLVEPLDSDYALGDTRLIIYPSILLAVKVDDIAKVYDKLNSYKRRGDTDEEIDED